MQFKDYLEQKDICKMREEIVSLVPLATPNLFLLCTTTNIYQLTTSDSKRSAGGKEYTVEPANCSISTKEV